jgi:hypothetical protein
MGPIFPYSGLIGKGFAANAIASWSFRIVRRKLTDDMNCCKITERNWIENRELIWIPFPED